MKSLSVIKATSVVFAVPAVATVAQSGLPMLSGMFGLALAVVAGCAMLRALV